MENKNLQKTAMNLNPDTVDNPKTGGGSQGGSTGGGDGGTGNGDDPKSPC
ncbi:hypothetical protein [uncultured Tenacibaculum sp.]|nr:hypothetical protein [uncultured Tenacibaculum sp.]